MSLCLPLRLRGAVATHALAGLLAAIAAGCGPAEPPGQSPAAARPPSAAAAPPAAPAGPRDDAPSSTAPSPAQPPAPRAVAPRIGARGTPDVEACIERNIHDPAHDAMNPRDPRRRLWRLEVKAACEERLASR